MREQRKSGIIKALLREKGEILFTNYGVSGPILQFAAAPVSGAAGHQPILKIIVVDDMNEEELREHIVHRLEQEARNHRIYFW